MKLKKASDLVLVLRFLFVIILPITGVIAQIKSTDYSIPLGIAMESYPYPYPVRFLSLEVEKQSIRMAYMDVQPARAQRPHSHPSARQELLW